MSSLHHRSTTIAADDPAEIKQAYNYVRNTWFKQSATRVSAESDLKNATAGSFLVRPSSKSGCMALSFKTQDRVVHSVIENSREGYFVLIAISGTGQQKKIGPFKNILQVLGKLDNLALPSFISNALKENRPIFTQPKQQQQQHHHHQQRQQRTSQTQSSQNQFTSHNSFQSSTSDYDKMPTAPSSSYDSVGNLPGLPMQYNSVPKAGQYDSVASANTPPKPPRADDNDYSLMPPPEQLYGSVPPAKEERYKRLQPTANSESDYGVAPMPAVIPTAENDYGAAPPAVDVAGYGRTPTAATGPRYENLQLKTSDKQQQISELEKTLSNCMQARNAVLQQFNQTNNPQQKQQCHEQLAKLDISLQHWNMRLNELKGVKSAQYGGVPGQTATKSPRSSHPARRLSRTAATADGLKAQYDRPPAHSPRLLRPDDLTIRPSHKFQSTQLNNSSQACDVCQKSLTTQAQMCMICNVVCHAHCRGPAGSKNCKKVEAEYGRSPLELYDESSVMSASGRPWLMPLPTDPLRLRLSKAVRYFLDEEWKFGAACGVTITVLLEPLATILPPPSNQAAQHLAAQFAAVRRASANLFANADTTQAALEAIAVATGNNNDLDVIHGFADTFVAAMPLLNAAFSEFTSKLPRCKATLLNNIQSNEAKKIISKAQKSNGNDVVLMLHRPLIHIRELAQTIDRFVKVLRQLAPNLAAQAEEISKTVDAFLRARGGMTVLLNDIETSLRQSNHSSLANLVQK